MGGFFGATSRRNCVLDVFFGTDYHSHLGTRRGGMAAFDPEKGLQREIHNIENSPFRTKFQRILEEMTGTAAIGCISDTDPQPILIRSNLGCYAICTIGIINNSEQLINQYLTFSGGHFEGMSGGKINANELIAALIDQKSSFTEGIRFAQEMVDGTASILILREGGHIIAARDKMGRLPIVIEKKEDAYCATFEDYAGEKLGYEIVRELGPGEIVEISPDGIEVLSPPRKEKKICAFLWSYYGYPTACYEGKSVEYMRYRNGRIMAKTDKENGIAQDIDYVGGVPDSGTPHAIGYANESGVPFARPFIKYTPTWPRSFMPATQEERNMVAKMKQIPVDELIRDKKLLFVDDSIVRGTQLRETVDFLYEHGAKDVHIRSACPPILYACKYLNFSRSTSDNDLIARSTIRELEGEEGLEHLDEYMDASTERGKNMRKAICEKLHFSSLEYQSLEGILEAIDLPPCEVCTYCWNGKE
ncbi:MAG: amidophosphoribosyltransferase [Clostridiales bacterium]|nr:amidophosphoribosyltransferase [Clostridiales bacterium]MCI7574918.1 amidophosphoribosyltransferase [Clostridiales bacterium]MDY5642969.1 amidophosphoribosyltransferase [Candidatus Faecousia sp.]